MEAQRAIPAEAWITCLGFDGLSLKKRHKLYVTVMSDPSDPEQPRVLDVVKGRHGLAQPQQLVQSLMSVTLRKIKLDGVWIGEGGCGALDAASCDQ